MGIKERIEGITTAAETAIGYLQNFRDEHPSLMRVYDFLFFLGKTGVFAGLVLALTHPLFNPLLSDLHVTLGVANQPDIESNTFLYHEDESGIEKYSFVLENTNNKLASDVRFHVYFKGCAVKKQVDTFGGTHPENIRTGQIQSNCAELIYIENFRPNQRIAITYYVDSTHTRGTLRKDGMAVFSGDYIWRYNGQTYVQSIQIECTHSQLDRGYINECKKSRTT